MPGKKANGKRGSAGKKEGCPYSSFEKRDRKRNWRTWTELLSFSARQGRLCTAENAAPDQFSDWPQLPFLSAVGVWWTPKTIPALCRAATAQLHTRVGFPQADLRNVFPVFTPFFLWPCVGRPQFPSRHGFASRDLSLGLTIARSAGQRAEPPPLNCTETWGCISTTHGDAAVCCKHLLD